MGKLRTATSFVFGGLAALIWLTLGILSLIIHIYTIIVAYAISGLFGAAVSLSLPFFAQVYWFIRIWYITGTVFTYYGLAIMAWVGLVAILIAGVAIWTLLISKEK